MALMVDEIVDIVEEEFDIEVTDERPGILGSAIVKGEATDIVDVGHYLPIAFADWFNGHGRTRERAQRHLLLVDDSAFFREHAGSRSAGGGIHESPPRLAASGGARSAVSAAENSLILS